MRKGTLIDIPEHVHLVSDQPNLHKLMHAADCIVSPATSVIIPALAMNKPFVNLLQPDRDQYNDVDLGELTGLLGDAVIHPNRIDEAICGEITIDEAVTSKVFHALGYSADGRNGERVLDLCGHILAEGEATGWTFST